MLNINDMLSNCVIYIHTHTHTHTVKNKMLINTLKIYSGLSETYKNVKINILFLTIYIYNIINHLLQDI